MTETRRLEPILRPNGKLYRPRSIRLVGFDNDYTDEPQVAVLGTHDIALAERVSRPYRLPYLTSPYTSWLRDSIRDGEQFYVEDPDRGAACVVFTETEDPEEVPS